MTPSTLFSSRYRCFLWAALGALTMAAPAAFAAGEMPALQDQGPLKYRCGGIGVDESTAMRAAMKDYPLSLLFAAKDGEYLADLSVTLEGGKAPQTFTANGPVCLLQLAPGSYTVRVTTKDGQSKSLPARVGAQNQTLDFRF